MSERNIMHIIIDTCTLNMELCILSMPSANLTFAYNCSGGGLTWWKFNFLKLLDNVLREIVLILIVYVVYYQFFHYSKQVTIVKPLVSWILNDS